MDAHKSGFRETQRDTAADTTLTQRIKVESPTRRVFVVAVALTDDTTANAIGTIGIESGGHFYKLASLDCATAGRAYIQRLNTWLYEGERIRVDWSAIVAADVVEVFVVGQQEVER